MDRDLVVIGGSAGSLPALLRLVRSLPSTLLSTILVAVHRSAEGPAVLPDVLGRASRLPVDYAVDDEPARPGRIYVAPPDHHLLVDDDRLRVTRGPREHGLRPAVDPLFRTAAEAAGARVIGIVLSGALDDGAEGLAIVKQHGGVAIVQRPDDAEYPDMPRHALEAAAVDHVLAADEIGIAVTRLAAAGRRGPPGARRYATADVAESGRPGLSEGPPRGRMIPLRCPECGGALWETDVLGVRRLRCHVGHE